MKDENNLKKKLFLCKTLVKAEVVNYFKQENGIHTRQPKMSNENATVFVVGF